MSLSVICCSITNHPPILVARNDFLAHRSVGLQVGQASAGVVWLCSLRWLGKLRAGGATMDMGAGRQLECLWCPPSDLPVPVPSLLSRLDRASFLAV